MTSTVSAESHTQTHASGEPTVPRDAARNVPSARYTDAELRVLHFVNPFVAALLRSPLHRIVSSGLMLLTYTGRKSGQQYTIPVGYTRLGNDLLVFTYYAWSRNIRGGAPVTVNLQGRLMTAQAEVIEDSDRVIAEVDRLAAAVGKKQAFARAGIKLSTTPLPTREELARALAGSVVVRIRLDAAERKVSMSPSIVV